MNLRPRSSPPPLRTALLVLLLGLVCSSAAMAGEGFTIRSSSDIVVMPVGSKDYVVLGPDPVVYPLNGPGVLYGWIRAGFADGETEPKVGTITVTGVGGQVFDLPMTFKPSSKSSWGDGRTGTPSGGRKFEIQVPEGTWNAMFTGLLPTGGELVLRAMYDGPAQPKAKSSAAGKGETKKKNPWKYRNSFGLEVIYDDNITTQGDEGIDGFVEGGFAPGLYVIGSVDDLLLAPSLSFSAERKFWDIGKTRFQFRVKRWMYTQNPIKTNTDLHFYMRQYWGKKKNLELYYHYAPEQYIRQLGDRPPYGGDFAYREFRFTRNVAYAMWRHTVSKKISYSLQYERNFRYYSKAFIENDIEAWEIRARLSYKPHKKLKLDFDYSYEDGTARGIDTVEEIPETSDDGDGSYLRDLYRVGVSWSTPWAMPVFSSVDGSALFMDYYYPTEKPLFEDPYHTGRRDKMIKLTINFRRKINKRLKVYGSFRYSDRVVDSPWYGDITLDKDYTQHRYWVGMTYSF